MSILNTSNYTYPDLSVTCDERDQENPLYITYPCLIVEVLSDSTEAYDPPSEALCERGKKFEKYRRNPNPVDYVLVSSNEMAIDIYHRNQAGDWVILSYRKGDQVELKSINLSLSIEQLYEEVVFEPQNQEEGSD